MPEAAVNHFKADLRAIQFTLYEHLHVEQLFAHDAFSHLSREECDATIANFRSVRRNAISRIRNATEARTATA